MFKRILRAWERRNLRAERDAIYRHDLHLSAAGRLVHINARLLELGDKPRPSMPYIGEESVRLVAGQPVVLHAGKAYKISGGEAGQSYPVSLIVDRTAIDGANAANRCGS